MPLRASDFAIVGCALIVVACSCGVELASSQQPPTPAPSTIPPTLQISQQLNVTTAKPNYLETGRKITGILDRFMSLGYDKRVRPNYGGPPVEVNVTMRILSISSVSEVMMDFTADFYFRQTWHDPRLSFKKLGDIQTLYVGAEVSKKIWLPDTFFGNEKLAYFHEATTPNVFLRIDHSGEVYRSIRLTVTSSCPMNLQYFPMDRQRCTIEAESYGYNVKDIIYRWARKSAVERDKEISLPQFDIVKTVQKYRLEELSSGTYSRLIAEIHFARRMGYYLIQIYIPSSLIVVISWVSFWLHRNASPARVQLGVTTVLTMTTLMSSTNAALPKISYVKSIDIFLGTCFVMVFAALLEYATVGYLGKRIAMRKAQAQHAQSQAQARLLAQLQAQGAQGDSMPPTATPTLFGMDPGAAAASAAAAKQAQKSPVLANPNTALSSSQQAAFIQHLAAEMANSEAARSSSPPPRAPERHHQCPHAHYGLAASAHHAHHAHHPHHSSQHAHSHVQHTHHHHHQRACDAEHAGSAACTCAGRAPEVHTANPSVCSQHRHMHERNRYQSGGGISTGECACACTCGAASQTLPRNITFASGAQLETMAAPKQHRHAMSPQRAHPGGSCCAQAASSAGPAKSKASIAATAAAATFVNMHRRNKGLPPSTNPNFAQFAWLGQYNRSLETIFGVRPSDIDKYSRVIFPVCFVCFQLMYWIVYLHISAFLESEQQPPPT